MRDLDDHVSRALDLVEPAPAREVALAQALGLTAAADLAAATASPAFDNSAMDGYAVRAADTAGASPDRPVVLTVAGETAAGAAPAALPPGSAWRIMTGAPVPAGADAIVPVEHTDGGTARVVIAHPTDAGRHVRRRGEDAVPGDAVVAAGTELTAARIGALAAVGVATALAVPAPRVAILATGDELVDPGADLAPGQIHDSNSLLLAGLVREAGAQPIVLDRVGDWPGALLERLEGVDADLIVTTGGVSVGAYDVVKAALAGRGVEFAQVAMQPGKPQGLGTVGGTPIACLPGNPVSVLVSFAVIVRPMIDRLAGRAAASSEQVAKAGEGWRTAPGRRQFMPVRFADNGHVVPATAGGSGSHLMARLAAAEALADVPAGVERVEPGDTVGVVRWRR